MTASPKRLSTLPSKPLSAKNLNKLETSASVFIGVIKENSFRPAAAGIISTSSPDILRSPNPDPAVRLRHHVGEEKVETG
jgi:hypothetical protein